MTFPRPTRLTPREIALVESHLIGGRGAVQNFEMLDGFFAALVTGPELVMPSRYLPLLLGDPDDPEVVPIANLKEAQRFLDLLMRHWNLQVTTFMAGEPWSLWLTSLDGDRTGQAWAKGFEIGAEMLAGWDRVTRGDTHVDLLGSVTWLANEDSPDPKLRPPAFAAGDREAMLGAIARGLPLLYAATRPGAGQPPRPRPGNQAGSRKKPRRRR